jgi:hypothetical protein
LAGGRTAVFAGTATLGTQKITFENNVEFRNGTKLTVTRDTEINIDNNKNLVLEGAASIVYGATSKTSVLTMEGGTIAKTGAGESSIAITINTKTNLLGKKLSSDLVRVDQGTLVLDGGGTFANGAAPAAVAGQQPGSVVRSIRVAKDSTLVFASLTSDVRTYSLRNVSVVVDGTLEVSVFCNPNR